jgi:hypothetical protein
VRVQDHLVLSSIAAAALYPVLGRKVVVPWAASLLIDVDHYAWYTLSRRTLNPIEAVRYFNQAQPEQHAGTRRLHSPDVLGALWLGGQLWKPLRLVFYGFLFHMSVDYAHSKWSAKARRLTLERDQGVCRRCGAADDTVVAHIWRQPKVLPSYRIEHLVSLCGPCHELAHARRLTFE